MNKHFYFTLDENLGSNYKCKTGLRVRHAFKLKRLGKHHDLFVHENIIRNDDYIFLFLLVL